MRRYPVPDEVFLVLELSPSSLAGASGLVRYRPEFGRLWRPVIDAARVADEHQRTSRGGAVACALFDEVDRTLSCERSLRCDSDELKSASGLTLHASQTTRARILLRRNGRR